MIRALRHLLTRGDRVRSAARSRADGTNRGLCALAVPGVLAARETRRPRALAVPRVLAAGLLPCVFIASDQRSGA